jgi:hypothetical protein
MDTEGRSEAVVEKHGGSGYRKGCRCDVCRAAKRVYEQKARQKRMAALAAGEANFDHGYEGYTRWGCRCQVCKEAKADYQSGRGRGTGQKEYMQKYRQGRKAARAKGEVKVSHGLSGYTNDGCRCETCTEGYAAYRAANRDKQYHVVHPDESREAQRLKMVKWQAQTLEGATRHGQQWTGPELEVAGRSDLTTREVALMLGRTFAAVSNVRKKLKGDPKTIMTAGIPRGSERQDNNSSETGNDVS